MSNRATVEPGVLTLCCSSLDSSPLFWTDPDGSRHGYEVEAAAAIAANAGLELRWIFRQWSDFPPALERRECDAIWCGCAITPDRRRLLEFTRPYAVFNESVVVRPDSTVSSPARRSSRLEATRMTYSATCLTRCARARSTLS